MPMLMMFWMLLERPGAESGAARGTWIAPSISTGAAGAAAWFGGGGGIAKAVFVLLLAS